MALACWYCSAHYMQTILPRGKKTVHTSVLCPFFFFEKKLSQKPPADLSFLLGQNAVTGARDYSIKTLPLEVQFQALLEESTDCRVMSAIMMYTGKKGMAVGKATNKVSPRRVKARKAGHGSTPDMTTQSRSSDRLRSS